MVGSGSALLNRLQIRGGSRFGSIRNPDPNQHNVDPKHSSNVAMEELPAFNNFMELHFFLIF